MPEDIVGEEAKEAFINHLNQKMAFDDDFCKLKKTDFKKNKSLANFYKLISNSILVSTKMKNYIF